MKVREPDVFAAQLRKPKLNPLELKLRYVLVIEPGDKIIRVLIAHVRKITSDLRSGGWLNDRTRVPKTASGITQHYRTWKQIAWPPGSMQSRLRIHGDKHKFAIGHFSVGALLEYR